MTFPTVSPCVDIFHVDPSHSRDSVERRVRKQYLMNHVHLVQLGGHVMNPEDPYTVVHVRQDRLATVSDRTKWRAKLEESWRPTTVALFMRNEKPRSHLVNVADLARGQHRRGGRVVVTFLWTGRKEILTNCADTARLVGRSRCCSSPNFLTFGEVIPRKLVSVTRSISVERVSPGRFSAQLRSSRRPRGDSLSVRGGRCESTCNQSDSHQPWTHAELDARKADLRCWWK